MATTIAPERWGRETRQCGWSGGEIRSCKKKSWKNATLGTVIADLAKKRQLTHRVDVTLAKVTIPGNPPEFHRSVK